MLAAQAMLAKEMALEKEKAAAQAAALAAAIPEGETAAVEENLPVSSGRRDARSLLL